jgi:hypothetical protein
MDKRFFDCGPFLGRAFMPWQTFFGGRSRSWGKIELFTMADPGWMRYETVLFPNPLLNRQIARGVSARGRTCGTTHGGLALINRIRLSGPQYKLVVR